MAIYSLTHRHLGKSHKDYKPGVARAHANYITRESSCRKVLGARAPTDRQILKAWLDREERDDRKNARIIDKLVIALPLELSKDQQEALITAFCEQVTEGRASWVAAIHDRGKDTHNPHVHIVLRDRDIQTGRRVMLTTELGSTERFRKEWERVANTALKDAGLDLHIDRRTLKEQGIERTAEEHRGPRRARTEGRSKSPDRLAELFVASLDDAAHRRSMVDEEERARSRQGGDHDRDWTARGGMVAQQWSAIHWAKDATSAANDRPVSGNKKTGRFKVELTEEQKEKLANLPEMTRGGLTR
jgi:hypothetical protein